jgi:hypothetical protein
MMLETFLPGIIMGSIAVLAMLVGLALEYHGRRRIRLLHKRGGKK